jgi:hypothetical protein
MTRKGIGLIFPNLSVAGLQPKAGGRKAIRSWRHVIVTSEEFTFPPKDFELCSSIRGNTLKSEAETLKAEGQNKQKFCEALTLVS